MRRPLIELDSPATDAIDGRQIRAVAFQRARLEYLERTLASVDLGPAGQRALVVGGGRGLLPRGLARLGFDVVTVDPSERATGLATELAAREGLTIEHRTAPAERLDVPAAGFDLAYYADTFEITRDLDRVLEQASRALRPGGTLVYDTVNRTPVSRLIYLGAFQRFPGTRIMPPGRYAAGRLRRPDELVETLRRHGLRNEDICGFRPRNVARLVTAILARRRGRITDDDIPAVVDIVLAPADPPVVTYLGHARRV
ncbi:MAG TPA: methyltransferase domain-containing protein [Pseudonocardia sp.]|jgi:2-polyprenyl-6-hydroxyphenyl methylase/3-demethylubiquinone-9 3-methyltransferase|nr:methyltransferase domain-containing protein [Pseudonocardia sp.]